MLSGLLSLASLAHGEACNCHTILAGYTGAGQTTCCPGGMSPGTGDGSACHGGGRTSCALYSNPQYPRCSTSSCTIILSGYTGAGNYVCCPEFMTTYGDGSACSGSGYTSCALYGNLLSTNWLPRCATVVGGVMQWVCTPCTNAGDCNSHGTAAGYIGVCSCTCKNNYAGSACGSCANGYTRYPNCSTTTVSLSESGTLSHSGKTASDSPTPSPTASHSNSNTATRSASASDSHSRTLSGLTASPSPSLTESAPTPSQLTPTVTVSPGTSTSTPSLSSTASQSKIATPTLSHPMSQSFSLSVSDTPQTPSPSRSLSFPSPSLSISVTNSATNTPDATPTQKESPSIQGFCPLHGAPLSSSPPSIPVVDVAYNPTTTVGVNVSGSVDSLHAGHLRPEWTTQLLSTDSSESAGGPTATTQSSRRLPISASLVSGPVTLVSPSSPSALIGPGEWIDLAPADGGHVPVTFRLIRGTRLDEEHLVVIDFSQSSFDFPVPYSGGGTLCNFSLVKNRVLIRLTQLVPPPLSPELLLAQEVTSTTGVTVATATLSGSLSLTTNLPLAVAAYAMCAFSYTEHLSWMFSPTFLLIGPEEGAPFRGAIVGNLLVMFGFYLLVLTALVVRHHVLSDPTWAHSRHRLHFPGILALPYFFLLAGTVSSSVTLIRHGYMWLPVFDPIIGSLSLLIWSLPLILFIQRTTQRFAFDATYQDEDEMELERILMNQDKVSFIEEVLLGRGHWKDNGRGFKYNWGVTFMDYRGLRQWYICVELIFALLIAAMEGFKPRTASGCQNVLIVYFVLAVLNLLIVCWARPCISRANTINSISIAVLLVASTGCLILGGPLEVPALSVAGAYCALASSFLAGLKGFFDAACTLQRRYRSLRARFERNRRPQQVNLDREDSDSTPEDPEEGAEMEERRVPGLDAPLLGIPSIVQSPVPQSESSSLFGPSSDEEGYQPTVQQPGRGYIDISSGRNPLDPTINTNDDEVAQGTEEIDASRTGTPPQQQFVLPVPQFLSQSRQEDIDPETFDDTETPLPQRRPSTPQVQSSDRTGGQQQHRRRGITLSQFSGVLRRNDLRDIIVDDETQEMHDAL